MKFAENPPKKYEDIVNVDFDQPDWRALWEELANVVRFWIGEGVRIFRVDNPHTKPFAFWHWLIDEIQAEDPDVLFLAEAFTRPKIMRRLAKEGFSQSYTYFTWRNTKAELTDYLTELTRGESAEYLRPNFFTNTPDILPFFLQEGGRAAFRIRLVLAATLSSTYGIYSGFELCENDALPGREEYRDSEKYEFKVRDWDRPGNIKDDIRKLNALRAGSEALQRFDNLEFHPSSHPSVLFYSKSGQAGGGRIIVAVTVDPRQVAETDVEFPASVGGRFTTEELFSGWRQDWIDTRQRIRIDPSVQPALVWRLL
jgi:starch synthase (maltosyl-transferring)